jgi:2-methylcitrate dehydratase PrpD
VRDRLRLVLIDVLGVTLAGARDPEQQRLLEAWDVLPGPSPVLGAGHLTSVEAAAWLNASALVRLELDEGNKYAKGHPAAHGFPAVLALAAAMDASGEELLASLLAAYEVSSRFGRATRLRPGLHPHGSWGVPGAAAGCARLLRLDGDALAAAIDTASGMPVAAHFQSALDGNRVRDAWMGAANLAGLSAARMAAAGVATNTGTAAFSLGEILGDFDPVELTTGLGERWDVELGYFKQHAACSFTHPAADAVIALRQGGQLPAPADIDAITVETHSLAAALDRQVWTNRLSAMFSIPFVVAAAAVHGSVLPEVSSHAGLATFDVRALAERVEVVVAEDLDARLPDERPVRVTVHAAGRMMIVERPNPVGDTAFHPFDEGRLVEVLARLLGGPEHVDQVVALVDGVLDGTSGGAALRTLAPTANPLPARPRDAAHS